MINTDMYFAYCYAPLFLQVGSGGVTPPTFYQVVGFFIKLSDFWLMLSDSLLKLSDFWLPLSDLFRKQSALESFFTEVSVLTIKKIGY